MCCIQGKYLSGSTAAYEAKTWEAMSAETKETRTPEKIGAVRPKTHCSWRNKKKEKMQKRAAGRRMGMDGLTGNFCCKCSFETSVANFIDTLIRGALGVHWCIVSSLQMTTQSLFSASGLLLGERIRSWGHDVSAVAAASTTMVAVQNVYGILSGYLIQKWHARTLGVVGTILVFSGLVLTSRATELWMVFVTWGLVAGVGMGMVVPTAFLILTHYFERYRRYAIGVAVVGTGVGQMLLPLVLHGLLIEYQFSGACLIIASISLQALPAYLLCRPMKPKPVPVRSDSSGSINIGVRRRYRDCRKCRILLRKCYYTTGFALLADPVIANTIICSSLIYMTIISFTAVLPLYLKDGGKLSPKLVAHFMTIMSGSDLAARVILPIAQEKLKISARTVVMTSALAGAVVRSIMVEFPDRSVILMTLIMSGISRAAIVLNINLSLAEMVGPAELMATIGVSMVCKAVSTLTAGIFIGWLHDITKSYQVYLHSLTLVVIITFALWLTESILIRRQNRRNNGREALREIDEDLDVFRTPPIAVASRTDLVDGSPRRGSPHDDVVPDGLDVEVLRQETKTDLKSSAGRTRRKSVRCSKKKNVTFERGSENVSRRPYADKSSDKVRNQSQRTNEIVNRTTSTVVKE